MNKTKIEYLTHTWNPIAMRCTPVSDACENCWHLATCGRLKKNPKIDREIRAIYAGDMPPALIKYRLDSPLKKKKPSIIGVQFMGDIFHERIWPVYLLDIMKTIRECPQHVFLILTKRPHRILPSFKFPDNVWLGVTVENQKTADGRIPILLQIPAKVRFVSVEPMLSPVDISKYLGIAHADDIDNLNYGEHGPWRDGINWVICGSETGSKARPMKLNWAIDLKNQCRAANVPFFFKTASKGDTVPDELMIREFPR